MKAQTIGFGAYALFTLSAVLSSPVAEEVSIVLISELILPSSNSSSNSSSPTLDKLRQDGDGDGDAAEAAGAGFNGAVGTNVANILQGVLGGGFENIFKGATSFIGEEDTQKGVSTILSALAKPLNMVFASGFQSGQKYFGFGPTTPATLNGTQAVVAGAEVVTVAPVVTTTETKETDDEDEADAEAKLRKQK